MTHSAHQKLVAELNRLREEADHIDIEYAAGRATVADIRQSEKRLDAAVCKLACCDCGCKGY